MRLTRILLILVAVVCFGVALSYPIRYRLAQNENNANMDGLAALRDKAMQTADDSPEDDPKGTPNVEGASGVETDGGEEAADAASDEAAAAARTTDETDPWADDGAEAGEDEDGVPAMPTRPTLPPEDASGGGAEVAPGTDGTAPTGAEAAPPAVEAVGGVETAGGADDNSQTGDQPGEAAAPKDGAALRESAAPEPTDTPEPTPEPTPVANPGLDLLLLEGCATPTPEPTQAPASHDTANLKMAETPEPSPTPVWDEYTGPLPYPMLEKVEFDASQILPELREIYALNRDLVGWITIPGTVIDYPVVQCQDSDYYLEHDFYGNANINGQIILDTLCDPYTPSYNLIISGHHMKNGSMFGDLPEYRTQAYWEKHKLLEFDSLMFRKQYVVFAAFYSADYDEDEEGFRYNADIQYNMEAKQWLREIKMNQLYDTGIDVQFGDEFITLTTCNRALHRNGRFVVVCRRVREGETIE